VGGGGNNDGNAGGRVGGGRGWGSIIGTYAGIIVLEASGEDQSLDRAFRMTNDRGMPASARGLVAGVVAVVISGGAAKAADVSYNKDFLDNGNGDDNGGDNDNAGDNVDRAIYLPNTAAAKNDNDDDDEGVQRKTLITATIRRKTDAANTDILEGGASSRRTTKLRQYLSLIFEASAPPRSGSS
jgi:hypothetical protein